MRTWAAIALAITIEGCGAKSALEVDAPAARDAGEVAIDAGFGTFPCRWTAGRALAFARSDGVIDSIAAAVALRSELVHVRARRDSTWDDVAFLLATGDPPFVRSEASVFDVEPATDRFLFAGRTGPERDAGELWLEVGSDAGACWLHARDLELRTLRTIALLHESACRAHSLGGIAPALATADGRLSSLGFEPRPEVRLPVSGLEVGLARGRDGAAIVAWRDPATGALSALAMREDGTTVAGPALRARIAAAPPVAPDRLITGVVVLARGDGRAALERIWLDDDVLRITTVVDLTELEARIPDDVALVTNETEALFPLVDGSLVFLPLNGTGIRIIPAPAEPGDLHRIVFAQGTSFGGHLWRSEDQRSLLFRTLVCNR